jgi:hypothetical protein
VAWDGTMLPSGKWWHDQRTAHDYHGLLLSLLEYKFPISLSFLVELVGACNSIWYQRSLVRIMAGALIKIITVPLQYPHMRPGGACT